VRDQEAIIIGGGPAGSSLAIRLAQMGWTVKLIERNIKPIRKVCGEYLCPAGVKELDLLGIGHQARTQFNGVEGLSIKAPNGTWVCGRFDATSKIMSSGLAVPRDRLDALLLHEAEKHGVQVELGRELKTLQPIKEGWRVTFFDGSSATTSLLVGADGRRSKVAQLAGLSDPHKEEKVAIHALIKSSGSSAEGKMILNKDGTYLGVNKINEHELNLSAVLPRQRFFNQAPKDVLIHCMKEHSEFSNLIDAIGKVHSTYPITHRVKSCISSHLALVGDAAGFLDPLTGEGITSALTMSRLLAHSLASHETQNNHHAALMSYARAKRRSLGPKTLLNNGFQWLIRHPKLCNLLGKYLAHSSSRAHAFIGMIGNTQSLTSSLLSLR